MSQGPPGPEARPTTWRAGPNDLLAYPLLLAPQLHRRVWGGERLLPMFGDETAQAGPEGEPVGESWLAGDDSLVTNGHYAGRSLRHLAEEHGPRLVGSVPFARYGARMPLLAKLLDAAEALSVQVHPDDDYALREEAHTGHLGKSEAWLVLAAEPGATVLWGLRGGTTPEALREAACAGTLPSLMHEVPVAAGDVIVNPAGTVHAVGAGILIYEIQQASDLTYRMYDYGRLDAQGAPRQLHLDEAVAVADFSGTPFVRPEPQHLSGPWIRLVTQPQFVLERAQVATHASAEGQVEPTSLQLLTAVEGAVTLTSKAGAWPAVYLSACHTVLLPAALTGEYQLTGSGVVLRSAVPARTLR